MNSFKGVLKKEEEKKEFEKAQKKKMKKKMKHHQNYEEKIYLALFMDPLQEKRKQIL